MRFKFQHPFARFSGETQQPGIGFQVEGDISIFGGGKSRFVKVTLDSDLISELEIRQVNDRSKSMILNDALESAHIPNGAQIPLVRRTGPKTWQFRTVANQGDAHGIGLAMIEPIARIYGPSGDVIWEKGFGDILDTQSKVEANVNPSVLARGGWGLNTGSDGQPYPRRPNHVGSSNNVWTLNTGMTPAKLADLLPAPPVVIADVDEDEIVVAEEDDGLTVSDKIVVGAGFGTALLVILYSVFSLFGRKRK